MISREPLNTGVRRNIVRVRVMFASALPEFTGSDAFRPMMYIVTLCITD
jgi:hypothetical protein